MEAGKETLPSVDSLVGSTKGDRAVSHTGGWLRETEQSTVRPSAELVAGRSES